MRSLSDPHLCSRYAASTVDVTARSASAMIGCRGAYASNLGGDHSLADEAAAHRSRDTCTVVCGHGVPVRSPYVAHAEWAT